MSGISFFVVQCNYPVFYNYFLVFIARDKELFPLCDISRYDVDFILIGSLSFSVIWVFFVGNKKSTSNKVKLFFYCK